MTDNTVRVERGEHWAYRARAADPFVEVQVLRIGKNKPPRVFVRFIDDEFEGREDWVPPSRLKVPWSEVDALRIYEERWATARRITADVMVAVDPVELEAVELVLGSFSDLPFDAGYGKDEGLLFLRDHQRAFEEFDLDPAEMLAAEGSFEDDGRLVAVWPAALTAAQRVAARRAEKLQAEMHADEVECRQKAIHGDHRRSRDGRSWFTPPDFFLEQLERDERVHAVVRAWCGVESADRFDELVALRAEVVRLGAIVTRAAEALDRAGLKRQSRQLEGDLGIPVADLLRRDQWFPTFPH